MSERLSDLAQCALSAINETRHELLVDDADDFVSGVIQQFHRSDGTHPRRRRRRTALSGMCQF
jgi:hypothetical protein